MYTHQYICVCVCVCVCVYMYIYMYIYIYYPSALPPGVGQILILPVESLTWYEDTYSTTRMRTHM